MTKELLKEKLRSAYQDYERAKRVIYKDYAAANNPYKEGDMITDHVATIKIESIGVYVSGEESQCVYTGIQYNKDGKVSKKQDHNIIYQMNIGK